MYDDRGEVVDGWETRRHAARDWAIVRLGVGGRLRTIDVDTRFFSGNQPTGCRVDACVLDPVADPTADTVKWTTIVGTVALKPDSHNVFAVDDARRYTHVRLRLESDGGVARLGPMATSSRTQRCGTESPSRCPAWSRAVASNGQATISIPTRAC